MALNSAESKDESIQIVSVQAMQIDELKKLIAESKFLFFGNDCPTYPVFVNNVAKRHRMKSSDILALVTSSLDVFGKKGCGLASIKAIVKDELKSMGIDLGGRSFAFFVSNPATPAPVRKPRPIIPEEFKPVRIKDENGKLIGFVCKKRNGKYTARHGYSSSYYELDTFESAKARVFKAVVDMEKFIKEHVKVIRITSERLEEGLKIADLT